MNSSGKNSSCDSADIDGSGNSKRGSAEITELDLRRLLCPLPVIRTQDQIKNMAEGEQLKILCTDPGVLEDIPVWCRMNGHEIIHSLDRGDEIEIIIVVRS